MKISTTRERILVSSRLQEMIAKARMRASECEQVRKAMFQQWSQEQHERIQDNST